MLIFILSIISFMALLLCIYFESITLFIIYVLIFLFMSINEYEKEREDEEKGLSEEDIEELYEEVNKESKNN